MLSCLKMGSTFYKSPFGLFFMSVVYEGGINVTMIMILVNTRL